MTTVTTATAPAGTDTVLVAGGTGFIGRAVVRELQARTGTGVRVLSSRGGTTPPAGSPVRHVRADLTCRDSLRGACDGVTTLVHTVSYVGRDAERCTAVNHDGTLALLDEARRAGVARVVHVSTASVYGGGPHRGAREEDLPLRPESAASASRMRAEQAVLDAGGAVLRPHLVHGDGDRWVVPAIDRLLRSVPAWPADCDPHISMIAVRDLARCVVSLALDPGAVHGPEIFHAADPRPVPMSRLKSALHRILGTPLPSVTVSRDEHRARIRRALPALSDHQYALLTEDHWYDADKLWARTGQHPGPGLEPRLAESRDWYLRYGS
ncbi:MULTISPECIES: NAD(P)-dependent oxidoreductase [unclassified Streptomyces]|uniref:NAD-dependent epimerase/dehydratase family protein n=1 Tax=unclassified Streptomyces TaxID=2593676 RepID=UPI000DC3A6A8|nr:NAD(P)-dependent oxidoreductase [Streptomyces sp. PsTaAH-137]RAJ69337.1 nucleoside-diphosphate-sugar epimerase [Streptomyces sp. PsTaAH-137]